MRPDPFFIHRLFDTITPSYDRFNVVASLGLDRFWRRKTIDQLRLTPGMTVLDLASGTGDLAGEAVRRMAPLGRVTACDLSYPMLEAARRKWDRHALEPWHLAYAQGVGEALPFADRSFDAATIGFALRNVSDLDAVFQELRRVLRPGGRIALLEFGRPRNFFLQIGHRFWLRVGIPFLGLLATRTVWPFLYLRRSILEFMPPEEVVQRLSKAGFTRAASQPLTGGVVRLYSAVSE